MTIPEIKSRYTVTFPSDARLFCAAFAIGAGLTMGVLGMVALLEIAKLIVRAAA